MLLYHVKHSKTDVANTVRKLCKVMDGANHAAFLEIHQVIKHVLDTQNLGLKIKSDENKNNP